MSGWGGSNGGGFSWNSECEATTSLADLNHTVLAPLEGATYYLGQQVNISWQSGIRSEVVHIDGPPWAGGVHPVSWQWSVFLESDDNKTSLTIMGIYSHLSLSSLNLPLSRFVH